MIVGAQLFADVAKAGRAIRLATEAVRINYAALGNVERHVHYHLIPRVARGDPIPSRPPWEHPQSRTSLPAAEAERLSGAIKAAMADDALTTRAF
jgi:diadenosine tetraphosphate (Ap4A) HIT family hydrolase